MLKERVDMDDGMLKGRVEDRIVYGKSDMEDIMLKERVTWKTEYLRKE